MIASGIKEIRRRIKVKGNRLSSKNCLTEMAMGSIHCPRSGVLQESAEFGEYRTGHSAGAEETMTSSGRVDAEVMVMRDSLVYRCTESIYIFTDILPKDNNGCI